MADARECTPHPKPAPRKPASKRRPINPVSDRKRAKRAESELSGVFGEVLLRATDPITRLAMCEHDPTQLGEHMHHRRRPGRVDTPLNLLYLSHRSHEMFHANVDWSNRHGLILATGDDPAVCVLGHSLDCDADHRCAAPTREEGDAE